MDRLRGALGQLFHRERYSRRSKEASHFAERCWSEHLSVNQDALFAWQADRTLVRGDCGQGEKSLQSETVPHPEKTRIQQVKAATWRECG